MPIYKNKENKKECNNFRRISLVSIAMKNLVQITDRRLISKLENTLHEPQSGFRNGGSTYTRPNIHRETNNTKSL